jgi:dTDP-4-amino-4,6-dideoxygalactose transaminase
MLKRIDLTRDFAKHRQEYLDAITRCCEETAFSGGPYADRFDKECAQYLGVAAASGVNNGTSALHLAMLCLGIGEGDEVIVPANTYIATAWGVTYSGATPVFVDCTADTWEIDPAKIEEKITDRTKAIIGVHLYGQPFDFGAVKEIADRHGLYVVEDCAQAAAAEYEGVRVGGLGDIGCFSFYPGKNLYSFGEGGSVTSNDPAYIDKVNVYKNQGCRIRYYHEVVGYNMRLEGIQGAVMSVSLKYLDEWTKRRIEIGTRYDREITNPLFRLQKHPANTKHVYHMYEVQVPDPEHFLAYMKEKDIECNRHYPVPCHLQEAYKDLGYQKGDCPNAEELAAHCATLPLFPEMTDEEVSMVIDAVNSYRG